MNIYLLWTSLALHSVALAASGVSIGSDPLYLSLPFCARDCVWNANNVNDIAESISFIFPCSNSCFCNPDTVDDALAHLSQCITSSPCCDMIDYNNAVALYYSYCDAHEPWSMSVPVGIGTAAPSPTSRTTQLSTTTPTWCSTAHSSPSSTSKSTTTKKSTTTQRQIPTVSALSAGISSSGGGGVGGSSSSSSATDLLPIILPSIGGAIVIAVLVFCACLIWRMRRMMRRSAAYQGLHPDSTPLIVLPSPRPASPLESEHAALALAHDSADEEGRGTDKLGSPLPPSAPPPPYQP